MINYKFSKGRPLLIEDVKTGEIIEIHVPKDYKNQSMRINIHMDKRFQILRQTKSADAENKKVESDENFNK